MESELLLTSCVGSKSYSPTPPFSETPASDTETAIPLSAQLGSDCLAVKSILDGEVPVTNDTKTSPNSASSFGLLLNMACSPWDPLINRFLRQKVLADSLLQYPLLSMLSIHGRNAFLALWLLYLLSLLLIWIPLWIVAFMVTELGVYCLLLISVFYGGRCLLRLLAFPGTNVRVYGEIELEFARYSCKMLEGACDALEDFSRSIQSGVVPTVGQPQEDENDSWTLQDVPETYKRVLVYRDRVLGVYWQVLHCLIEENGQGYDPSSKGTENTEIASFYGKNTIATCKRNLCCERNYTHNDNTSSDGQDISNSSHVLQFQPSAGNETIRTPYGNNPLVGDIGNMMNLTSKARLDGKELKILLSFILDDLSQLVASSFHILRCINDKSQLTSITVSEETKNHATRVIQRAGELRKLVLGMKPPPSSTFSGDDESLHVAESEVGANAVRQRLEDTGSTPSSSRIGMVNSVVQSIVGMIDPPPHKYIFGLDVIRGCLLARYHGANQFWVERCRGSCVGSGKIDVIQIPSMINCKCDTSLESHLPFSPRTGRERETVSLTTSIHRKQRKAVLYCNPNAGLSEVATGLGLTGGNIEQEKDNDKEGPTCWTDYYISHGYDVYLFNYAGYGRSYGSSSWWSGHAAEFHPGIFGTLRRLFTALHAFKPSSESLKLDATAVARHILEFGGVDQLILHGESIGGMAAAGAAKALSETPSPSTSLKKGTISLLICDRTFCNLESVAQRLVGSWTGNAIRLLTPTWNFDVANDFLAAKCPKIVANDAADEIIHDYSSLKSGLSFAGELTRGTTINLGRMMPAPLEYRLSNLENRSCTDSSSLTFKAFQVNSPTWPADKRISWKEAFHFAACVKRVGKLATAAKKEMPTISHDVSEDECESVEVKSKSHDVLSDSPLVIGSKVNDNPMPACTTALINAWNTLACCDGLCGRPLGHAVKEGLDCTVSWLCALLVFGSQVVGRAADRRRKLANDYSASIEDHNMILPNDFDNRPNDYVQDEYDGLKHPIPLPEVLSYLEGVTTQLKEVESEISYIKGMLVYIVRRLSSKGKAAVSLSEGSNSNDLQAVSSSGWFLNLHCGHNNQYSQTEREELISLIHLACGDQA